MSKSAAKTIEAININAVQSDYKEPVAAKQIDYFYTQANVTSQPMKLVTLTTVGNIKGHKLAMTETANGVLVSNEGGSMLVPYTNIRNIVYKA